MSDIVWAILAFVAFSMITDVIEGRKKKRKAQEIPPSEQSDAQAQRQHKREIVIPPLHMPRQEAPRSAHSPDFEQTPLTGHALCSPPARNVPQEAAIVVDSNYNEAKALKPADLHWNVLLSAVAYAQILQPPKAYQYISTKSCQGEWKNDK